MAPSDEANQAAEYTRYCPGAEHVKISDAVCHGRRRVNYPKCRGCPFNDDERDPVDAAPAPEQLPPEVVGRLTHTEDAEMDSVFHAYDVRATYPEPLNEDVAWRIGHASAQFLRSLLGGYERGDKRANSVVVGHDMRASSPALAGALIEGITSTGTDVIDIGMIDTPQIYFAVNHLGCCGGIQTTASHNPAQYNGFKICGLKGRPIGRETGLDDIRRIATVIGRHETGTTAAVRTEDLAVAYRKFIRGFLKDVPPTKAVIDASNGMAGRWFPIVFEDCPGLDIAAMNFEHDGTFVHEPNPLVEENLAALRQAVVAQQADFGACFDGDADRCMFVDGDGQIVPCDLLTALLAPMFLRQDPGSSIVYDLRSSRVVPEEIAKAGGVPVRQRVGHVFMKKALRDSKGIFGGELSGHFYFRDNWYCDSGLLAFVSVLNLLGQAGKPLGELIAPLRRYVSSGERNFKNDDKDGTISRLADRYADAEVDFLDGITVQYPDWWFNVRPSNTEPLLRLNAEAKNQKILDKHLTELAPLLGEPVEH